MSVRSMQRQHELGIALGRLIVEKALDSMYRDSPELTCSKLSSDSFICGIYEGVTKELSDWKELTQTGTLSMEIVLSNPKPGG